MTVFSLAVMVLVSGCGSGRRVLDRNDPVLDPKLSLSSYIEEGDSLALIVGTRQAGIVKDPNYLPLEIGVVNKGLTQLTLTPESFTLVDEDGNRYPMVTSEELYREYRRVDVDRRLGEIFQVMLGKFAVYSLVPSNFTPSFDNPTPRQRPVLQRYTLIHDLIYFPRPATGVRGFTFELFMDAPELESPVFVRFRVSGKTD
jgi:hypothetical protein